MKLIPRCSRNETGTMKYQFSFSIYNLSIFFTVKNVMLVPNLLKKSMLSNEVLDVLLKILVDKIFGIDHNLFSLDVTP